MLPIEVNGPLIGIFLKELVRRAIITIRNERFSFEATVKKGYSGNMDDIFTSADMKAQAIYEKSIREVLPGVGLIGEEGLSVPCTISNHNIYITIDPLDGTKAFVRRQSHGTATMVALVVDGEVASAWIGDINTLEIYGYRPGSNKVHRINEFEQSQYLHGINRDVALEKQYLLLRDFPSKDTPPCVMNTAQRFKKFHIDGSSIGTWFSRLWKGEYGAVVSDPGSETPWDSSPCIGISKKLGFVFLRSEDDTWCAFEPQVSQQTHARDYYTMVIHESVLGQINLS